MCDIKAILFDFDNTLSYGPVDGYLPIPILTQKFNLSEEQAFKLKEQELPLLRKFYMPEVSLHITDLQKEKVLHNYVYGIMADEIGLHDKEEFVRFMVDYRMNGLVFGLYPDVEEMLNQFKDKYDLHVFTNALPTREREVRNTPVGHLFDRIFVSNVLGFYKPQVEYYKLAI